jgi:hypothetical protein
MLTPRQLREELRRLLAGERTAEALEQARIHVAAYEARRGVPEAVQEPSRPVVALSPAEAADRAERERWRRLVGGRSPMSAVVYGGPSGREPASVGENERKTYARGASPWR